MAESIAEIEKLLTETYQESLSSERRDKLLSSTLGRTVALKSLF